MRLSAICGTHCRSKGAVSCRLKLVDPTPRIGSLFYPGTNIDRSPTRYTMDPAEVLAAFKSMREKGTVLGAIVHSHPGSPPTPSPTDLAEAYYPEALLVIVSFASGEPVVRVWQLGAQEPAEIALNIDSRA